eukprot:403371973
MVNTVIGKGAFGTVYSVDMYQRIKQKIAMKLVGRQERDQNQRIQQADLDEIEIMNQIDNPFINKLIDYYFQQNKETMQEELVLLQPLAMSDLKQFLENHYQEGGMPEKQAIEFLAQLAIGIKAMHDMRVIHRDLNPKNILVFKNDQLSPINDQSFILKISDFGCSKILEPNVYEAMSRVGKINYMAPEQLNNSNKGYNPKVDVYALGLTIFEMITGQVLNAGDIISRKPNVQDYSADFVNLLYQLCSIDHEMRPSIDEVIMNPIIQKSKTFINCLMKGIVSISKAKIEVAIDHLKNLQKIQTELQKQKFQWSAQYEIAIAKNHDKQYLMNKYQTELNNQNVLVDNPLTNCVFKRTVDEDGNIFIGFYKDGYKFYGRSYRQDSIKEGYIKNGKFNGQGCEFGTSQGRPTNYQYYYEGDYADNVFNGNGVSIFINGYMYQGQYKNGKNHGPAIYYWPICIGDKQIGQWDNGDMHGEGTFHSQGNYIKGNWIRNKEVGEYTIYYSDGRIEKRVLPN